MFEEATLAVGRLDGVSALLPDKALFLCACVSARWIRCRTTFSLVAYVATSVRVHARWRLSMARVALPDLSRLLDFLGNCYGVRDLDSFGCQVVAAMPRLVPADITVYNELDPRGQMLRWVWNPDTDVPTPDLDRAFDEHMGEHPLIAAETRYRDGRPRKISDFLTRSRFHDLGLYTEFFRHFDVEHQIAIGLSVRPPLVVGIALNRSVGDFSERERLLLDLVRPHLAQGYRNAEAVTAIGDGARLADRAIEELQHGVIVVNRAGQVLRASPSGRRWLDEYFPGAQRPARRLPESVLRWSRRHHAMAGGDRVPAAREALSVERDGRRLVVRHLCDRDACVLLLREQITALHPGMLDALGLTRREAEILAWLAQGKTNPEIAVILDTRPKTVSKHLERVYQKLGVETRTAAVAAALQATSGA